MWVSLRRRRLRQTDYVSTDPGVMGQSHIMRSPDAPADPGSPGAGTAAAGPHAPHRDAANRPDSAPGAEPDPPTEPAARPGR